MAKNWRLQRWQRGMELLHKLLLDDIRSKKARIKQEIKELEDEEEVAVRRETSER